MTPLSVRKAAFQYERTHPDASLSEAYMQGYLHHTASSAPPPAAESEASLPRLVPEASPSGLPTFPDIWNLYQRKDNKQSALKEWNKLKPEEQLLAARHIPAYVQAHPDKQFRPMLATYLHQKRFLDEEIITSSHGPTGQQQRLAAYASAINSLNPKM